MLNPKTQQRELCYVVKIDAIESITGSDNCEAAVVGGWRVMTRKGTFQPGDLAIYFEIDSQVPETKPFEFLKAKHYKIKTQKYTFGGKGNFVSQGLLMTAEDFGWVLADGGIVIDATGSVITDTDESRFLTKQLGVTYATAEDNARKATSADKYQRMAQRMGKKFSKQPYKWLMQHKFGKRILFLFYGQKKDKCTAWPRHIAEKTDVERIQNMIYILQDKQPFVATEKVDGSSCSVMCEKNLFGHIKQYICSRNVVFKSPDQKCYYNTNIYYEVYKKYNLGKKAIQIMKDYKLPNVAIQMEIYGKDIQKRDYSTEEHKIAVFHIVSNNVKFPMEKTAEICEKYNLPHVPILNTNYILPDTLEELQSFVEEENSQIDGLPKEGIVFYDKVTGKQYFKFVSPEYLIKYH